MDQFFFYSSLVIANIWIAAGYIATETNSQKGFYGIGVGLLWIFLAMISRIFS